MLSMTKNRACLGNVHRLFHSHTFKSKCKDKGKIDYRNEELKLLLSL